MVTPECCEQFMELKSTDMIGEEEVKKRGKLKVFAYHFQCSKCGKTKLEGFRK